MIALAKVRVAVTQALDVFLAPSVQERLKSVVHKLGNADITIVCGRGVQEFRHADVAVVCGGSVQEFCHGRVVGGLIKELRNSGVV